MIPGTSFYSIVFLKMAVLALQYDIHGEDGSVAELNSINVDVRPVTCATSLDGECSPLQIKLSNETVRVLDLVF